MSILRANFFELGAKQVTPAQLRMARAATRLGVREIAELAGVAPFTVSRFENEQGGLRLDTAEKLKRALKQLGVSFLDDDGTGAGVRFQPPSQSASR